MRLLRKREEKESSKCIQNLLEFLGLQSEKSNPELTKRASLDPCHYTFKEIRLRHGAEEPVHRLQPQNMEYSEHYTAAPGLTSTYLEPG